MDLNVVFRYFDSLNDENAMYIEFGNGGQVLVDNNDIVRGVVLTLQNLQMWLV